VFKYVANDQIRVRAKCEGKGCNWMLYAKVQKSDNKTVRVNTLVDKHNCGIVFNNRLLTAPWLANHFIENFRLNPNMDYQSFRDMMASAKFSDISTTKFYRAKKLAREMLEGSVRDQYAILDDYCRQLTSTNPGTIFTLLHVYIAICINCCIESVLFNLYLGTTALLKTSLVNGKRMFERVYICLKACKEGFRRDISRC
jgi:hypothetical protein